ncbi:RhoGAP-domain-containing protein [Phanerochaete sordida]|uniref:RhoGAP-domain-containing protein n=1 Tax=Phanerochaete sordida TaxID=48140 RepID=A0A9P3GIY3_9APHY|nr:RhoGAP-domain-containing protein [Phanerochaete sordida]
MAALSSNVMAQNVPDPAMLTENRMCPGCKESVVTENGGVVVAFGQSYFHIDCFRCAKCHQQVTADTNLLLLSDGSPVCANCSYCCNVCGQPILDEAIMTGDDSYHAHCFNCKVCKKRIEELVFAKTSQGIYCMPCHSERVARSKRHLERKEREKKERERQAQAEAAAAYDAITTTGANNASSKAGTPSTAPSSSTRSGTPRTSEFATAHAPSPTRATQSAHPSPDPRQQHFAATNASASSGTTPSVTSAAAHGALQRSGTLQNGLPSAPNQYTQQHREREREREAAATPDHMRSTSIPPANQEMLGVPSNGMQQALQKRPSFDDRPLNVVTDQNGGGDLSSNAPNQTGMLSPDGPTSRKAKRQSINPGLVMSFNNIPQGPSSPSTSPSTPHAPQMNGKPRSPLREQFANDVRASPPAFTRADSRQSPSIPRMQLDTSDTLHDRQYTGRTRSASSSDTQRVAQHELMQRERSRSPMRLSITLDRVPARTSSRAELRSDTAPPAFAPDTGRRTPQFAPEGRASPSLNVPNGSPLARQKSLDNRHRNSVSSLGQTIELPSRSRSTSRPTSPAHKVDVPRGVESGTDTEAEGEEEFHAQKESVRESLPPLPPPKESKGPKAGMRPPQLKLDSSHAPDDEHDDQTQVDSADVSEEYLHDEVLVESTSHSTFIAPALPPIRFSMGGADFAELLKSVGGPEGLKALDKIAEGQVPVTPPPTATQPVTPTGGRDLSADATPVKRREPPLNRSQSPHSIAVSSPSDSAARPPMQRSQSSEPVREGRPGKPRYEDQTVYKRERLDSNASLPPNARAHITLTTPENTTSSIARPDTSDLVRRRLQEALNESIERGAAYVKLDPEFIGAIIMLLNQRQEEFVDMKRKLDGMKRASQQYVDGMTVAQTEYDKELKARRDAEAEVTRLRVLLSSQAVRMKAMTGDTKKQEVQRQLSQELTESLSSLERDLSKLKVERDMTLAEVEELSASKSSNSIASDAVDESVRLSKALSIRFDNIKNQYQNDLLPLTAQREGLVREITELRASRDAYLEETTMLSARNEELAQLHAQYYRRMEISADGMSEQSGRDSSLDKARPPGIAASATSSTTAVSEESVDQRYVKISKQDAAEVQTPQPRGKFKWPGYRNQPAKEHASHMSESTKAKPRIEHNFQQVNGLRVARCDHCGDKMWGSIMRCGTCNIAVHHRCLQLVHLPCSQQANGKTDHAIQPAPGPSMFGRDLTEQVRADSKDEDRVIPVIVEKCIDAVDTLALDYEGIYRKTGGSGQSKAITQLFERGDYASFDLRDNDRFNDICSVTSVLKTYFRSLPDPLLTYQLHERFIYAANLKDPAQKGQAITELVAELPREHYYTTRALMLHLHRVAQRSEKNLMHARNLGVVFGPTLMRSRDPNAEFSDMAGKALSVEWLVENAPTVFEQHAADSP